MGFGIVAAGHAMPTAIVADLLGISATTATAWADAVARCRADYANHR